MNTTLILEIYIIFIIKYPKGMGWKLRFYACVCTETKHEI